MRLKQPTSLKSAGFTVIELLIATVIFSSVLLLLTEGLIHVSQMYLKGDTITKTQEAARTALNDIASAIQYGGNSGFTGDTVPVAGSQGFCANDKRFSYQIGNQLVAGPIAGPHQASHAIVVDTVAGGCTSSTTAQSLPNNAPPYDPLTALPTDSKELMGEGMRIQSLQIQSLDAAKTLWYVSIKVAYGDDTVLSANGCTQSFSTGDSFCAVSQLSTIVQKHVQ